ncbi:MAG: Hsp20/alpha crystallin family protein [Verrucomicrobiota bacterium]
MHKTSSTLQFSRRRLPMTLEPETHWVPNTDVYLADSGVVIKVELAGMQRENLQLEIEGSRLKISGQRADGCREARCKFLVMEINYGSFESLIELPPGYDLNQAKAAYQNGFLRIDVPPTGSVPSSEG